MLSCTCCNNFLHPRINFPDESCPLISMRVLRLQECFIVGELEPSTRTTNRSKNDQSFLILLSNSSQLFPETSKMFSHQFSRVIILPNLACTVVFMVRRARAPNDEWKHFLQMSDSMNGFYWQIKIPLLGRQKLCNAASSEASNGERNDARNKHLEHWLIINKFPFSVHYLINSNNIREMPP